MRVAYASAPSRRRGVAAVEFAVLLLLLVPLLLGLWEVGRLVEVQQYLNNAAREGARQASTGAKDADAVKQDVVTYLAQNGITVNPSEVTVSNATQGNSKLKDADQLDQLVVRVEIPFDRVRWVLLQQITTAKTLSAQATWACMRDLPITINTTIPLK